MKKIKFLEGPYAKFEEISINIKGVFEILREGAGGVGGVGWLGGHGHPQPPYFCPCLQYKYEIIKKKESSKWWQNQRTYSSFCNSILT